MMPRNQLCHPEEDASDDQKNKGMLKNIGVSDDKIYIYQK